MQKLRNYRRAGIYFVLGWLRLYINKLTNLEVLVRGMCAVSDQTGKLESVFGLKFICRSCLCAQRIP